MSAEYQRSPKSSRTDNDLPPKRDPRLVLVDAVWDADGISDVKSVTMALMRYLNPQFKTTTSVAGIAEIAGVHIKTARKVLGALVATGALVREDRFEAGVQTSPEWTLLPSMMPRAVTSVSKARQSKHVPPSVTPGVMGDPGVGSCVGVGVGRCMADDPESTIRGVDPEKENAREGTTPQAGPPGLTPGPSATQDPDDQPGGYDDQGADDDQGRDQEVADRDAPDVPAFPHGQPRDDVGRGDHVVGDGHRRGASREPPLGVVRQGGRSSGAGRDDHAGCAERPGPRTRDGHDDAGGSVSADPADVTAVWLAHSEFHTSNRGVPSIGASREIKAALNAGYTADDLIRVVRWAHLAPHKLASFLRGPEYEKGESVVGVYLAIPNLMRRANLDQRIAMAAEWEAKGSPNFRDAPQSAMTAQDREARIVKVLYQIVEANGNPEATENPKLTRAILDGLYEQGMSVEWIGGVDKDQVRWEYPKIARQLMKAVDEKRAVKAAGGAK